MVENENNLCHFPDLDNAIIQPSKIKTYLKLIVIFFFRYSFTNRGKIYVKGKGMVETYLLEHETDL